jgi:hypothetical protein
MANLLVTIDATRFRLFRDRMECIADMQPPRVLHGGLSMPGIHLASPSHTGVSTYPLLCHWTCRQDV